jgi:DNA polymerase-3 subunit epsilon
MVSGEMRTLMNTLCNPMMPIEKGASDVHGITEDKVRSAPDYLIALWEAKLITLALKPEYIVTYNGSMFDLPIANRLMGGVFGAAKSVDVLDVAYRYFPEVKGPNGKKTLEDLHQVFLNRTLEGAHDAMADVYGTWNVLEAMRKKIGKTMAQLAEELKSPKPYSVIPIGKYMGTLIDNMPRSWAQYMAQSSDLRPDLKATVDYILSR